MVNQYLGLILAGIFAGLICALPLSIILTMIYYYFFLRHKHYGSAPGPGYGLELIIFFVCCFILTTFILSTIVVIIAWKYA